MLVVEMPPDWFIFPLFMAIKSTWRELKFFCSLGPYIEGTNCYQEEEKRMNCDAGFQMDKPYLGTNHAAHVKKAGKINKSGGSSSATLSYKSQTKNW